MTGVLLLSVCDFVISPYLLLIPLISPYVLATQFIEIVNITVRKRNVHGRGLHLILRSLNMDIEAGTSSGFHRIVRFSDDEREELKVALEQVQSYPFNGICPANVTDLDIEKFVANSKLAFFQGAFRQLRSLLCSIKNDHHAPGVIILKNCPMDTNIPPTPIDGMRGRYWKQSVVIEAFITGLGCDLGEPIGHQEEKGGGLLHDLVPIKNTDEQLSNEGYEDFGLHVENSVFENRERFLLIYCVRPDHDKRAKTPMVDVRDVIKWLPEWVIEELRKAQFVIRKPYILNRAKVKNDSVPVAVFRGPIYAPEVRVTLYSEGTRALTSRGVLALKKFAEVANSIAVPYMLDTGDLAIINNHMVLHGRSEFTPRGDGMDRHLVRLYVAADLWSLRMNQVRSRRILMRTQ